MCAESLVVKRTSSGAEYACVASHWVTMALSSSRFSIRVPVAHSSTCRGWLTADQRSM